MKYTHFGVVVISLTVAGVAFPVRAASLPTTSASPASVAVEESPNELNAAPWGAGSQGLVEHSVAGELVGDLIINEAPWKSVFADGSSKAGQRALVDTMSLMASPAGAVPKMAREEREGSCGEQDQSIGPMGLRAASRNGESNFAWTAFLMLMPMIGGVFIAWDVRGGRRKNRGPAPDSVFLQDSPNLPRTAPAALAALGLTAECTEDDIKRAFRQRAMSSHPDRGGNARDFMSLERHFQESLRIVRGAATRASARLQPAKRQAA